MPDIGVATPLACDTADRVNAPHVGMDLKNEPRKFAKPRAIISCDASTILPEAVGDKKDFFV